MRIHILGICGTFMAGVAVIAKQLGYEVTGCDQNVYPPMSTYLESAGIEIQSGFEISSLDNVDVVIVGNVMKRGMPIIEHMLNHKIPMFSGPEWLSQHALSDKWVLCATGTHGKTTTSSMLAWILECAGLNPGYLIGGLPQDFSVPARITKSDFFVIEGDEYDTAFFDKRSKFVHYHPKTLVLGNLEFDHADIFDDLAMIQRQFHHLLKILPSEGLLIHPSNVPAIDQVIEMGCWSPQETLGDDWEVEMINPDGSELSIIYQKEAQGVLNWTHLGQHNASNALAAIAAANHAGVSITDSIKALSQFKGVKRRLELRGEIDGVRVYDDFAHHPTAITKTLNAMKAHVQNGRVIAVLEPRSNTMRMGIQADALRESLSIADAVYLYQSPTVKWNAAAALPSANVFDDTQALIDDLKSQLKPGDHIIVMSNGGFENLHERLLSKLALA